MKTSKESNQEPQKSTIHKVQKEQSTGGEATIKDNRPKSVFQRKLQAGMHNAGNNPILQRRTNNTGLPDNLKTGIENLSGFSMNDVKVHYNSSKPAQLQAHAYAQGTDIHLAPNQEKHLPHEAWHVVQQKQGRVKPTKQLKSKVNINDDAGLEKEADIMGAKALNKPHQSQSQLTSVNVLSKGKTIQRVLKKDTLNVVGEYHDISNEYREKESRFAQKNYGGYWEEGGFVHKYEGKNYLGDPYEYKILQAIYSSINKAKDGGIISGTLKSILEGKISGEKLDVGEETWELFGGMGQNNKKDEKIDFCQNYIFKKSIELSKAEEDIKSKFDKLEKLKYYKINNPLDLKNSIKTDVSTVGIVYSFYIDIRLSLNKIHGSLPSDSNVSSIKNPQKIITLINTYMEKVTAAEQACEILAKHHLGFENIGEKSETYGEESTKLVDYLTYERSLFMHKAANIALEKDVKGIWKVGDAHIMDMKKIPKEERGYNLVTFKEFYSQYGLGIVENQEKLAILLKKHTF